MVLKKIQKGGFVRVLTSILEIIAKIVMAVLILLFYIVRYLFDVCPNPDGSRSTDTCFVGSPWDWHLAAKEKNPKATTFNLLTGPGWRFIITCIKITLFIAIFCLGGPIVLLGGLIFLYTQVYSQLNTRVDNPQETISINT